MGLAAELARRQSKLHPDLLDWLNAPWVPLLPFTAGQTFRSRATVQDGRYVVRAELPGMDPDNDVNIAEDEGDADNARRAPRRA
jgi:HSP20 family protein